MSSPAFEGPISGWDSHVHLEGGLRRQKQTDRPQDEEPRAVLDAVLGSFVADQATARAERADLRLNPVRWRKRGVECREFRRALLRARARAQGSGVDLRYLMTIKRESSAEEVAEAVDVAKAAVDCGVVGLDVSRSYAVEDAGARPAASSLPPGLRERCAEARVAGLEVAVHCGGYDTEDDVWVAVDELGASRIGHGLAIGASKALVERIAGDRITIEVCPSSSIRQGVPLARHPARRWLEAGIPLSLGTDHPRALCTSLPEEARKLRTMMSATISDESPAAAG